MNGVEVRLTLHPSQGGEINEITWMPETPRVGETIFWATTTAARFWRVRHIRWVCDDQNRSVWHVEVSCGAA